ncbi:MAG: hypothetical protein ACYTG1_12720 [Planctomycetota bacterium]|jgi:hypothetical protein
MPRRTLPTCLLAVALVAVPAGPAAARDAVDASVRQLDRAVSRRGHSAQVALLQSLRQLRDPSLQSLFYRLVQHEQWPVQVHAVLGLAELDENSQIDPWLISQVQPEAQEAVVAVALDRDMLGAEAMQQLLEIREVAPLAELLVHAELLRAGERVDDDALARLARSGNIRVAAFASAAELQRGNGADFEQATARLDALAPRDRARHVIWLADAIRQYRLTALADFLGAELDRPDVDIALAERVVLALLALDPSRGAAAWRRQLGDTPARRDLVRWGLLLLYAQPGVPVETFDALDLDEPLVRHMADAGRGVGGSGDAAAAFIDLIDLGHLASAEWAVEATEHLDPADADRVLLHIIDTIEVERPGLDDRAMLAARSARLLFDREPHVVLDRLTLAEDDGVTQQVLLRALLETTAPEAGATAGTLRRIGSGRADSLALLLVARHSAELEEADVRRLGLVAGGGGRVSEVLQVQAAWLYLRHTGNTESALSRLFGR